MEAFTTGALFPTIADNISCPNHMSVQRQVHAGIGEKVLSDGTRLRAGNLVGVIHINANLHRLERMGTHFTMMRRLYKNVEYDLRYLAKLCVQNDESVEHIQVFRGSSHLAGPLAERLGFDVHTVFNPLWKFAIKHATRAQKEQLRKIYPASSRFTGAKQDVRDAYISRAKLIELYAEPTAPTRK